MFFFKENNPNPDRQTFIVRCYQTRELTEVEDGYQQLKSVDNPDFDLYNWSQLTNTVFLPLIEKGYTKDWIQKTDFRKIFYEYSVIQDAEIIAAAEKWAIDELYEIERIATEKVKNGKGEMEDNTPEKIQEIRDKLSAKKFRINEKGII